MKIIIVYDGRYTKSHIIGHLLKVGYNGEYKFALDIPDEDLIGYIRESSEIWTFGECSSDYTVLMAENIGVEVWQMEG
jgi:hypothetical protein